MKYLFQVAVIGMSSILFCGCTAMVNSRPLPDSAKTGIDKNSVGGIPYFLPRGRIQVDITWSKDTHEWLIKITPIIEADTATNAKFFVSPKSHWFFDSDVTLNTDANGLLSTVNGTLTDETTASVGNLVSAAASAFTFGASIGLSLPAAIPKATQNQIASAKINRAYNTPSYSFHGSFIPDNQTELDTPVLTVPETNLAGMTANQVYFAHFKLEVKRSENYDGLSNESFTNASAKSGGLVVRLPVRYHVTVNQVFADDINEALLMSSDTTSKDATVQSAESSDGTVNLSQTQKFLLGANTPSISKALKNQIMKDWADAASDARSKSVAEQIVVLPDSKHDYFLPLKGRMFVSDVNQIGFVSGMPLNMHKVRPSIVAGVTGIPKAILSAIVPVPGNIYQTQDNYYKSKDDAAKAATDTDTIK